MGFVTEQHEEFKAKIDADSAAYNPNYQIVRDSAPSETTDAPEPEPEPEPEEQSAPQ